jgi:glutathione S-transferase
MVTFNLTSLSRFGGRTIVDLPNVQAYVERIAKRPAYIQAMEIAGPAAKRPST